MRLKGQDSTQYRKLPGRKRTFLWRHRLHLADDHILSSAIGTFSFSEHYCRFYLRDIQAISIRRTWSAVIMGILTFVLAGLLVWAAWAIGGDGGVFFYVLAAIPAVAGVVTLARGHSCRCHVQTAVQVGEIPALNRIRAARKAMTVILPLIHAAQSDFAAAHQAAYRQEISGTRPGDFQPQQPSSDNRQTPTGGAL